MQPHEPQHTRTPCPSPTPRVHPNPCPSSQWCHPTISSSVIPFASCPQSFPASGSFEMSQLFSSDGQSIRVSASKIFRFFTFYSFWQYLSFSWCIRTQFSSVQLLSLSVLSNSVIPWTAARQASLSITNSQSLLKLMYIELVMPSNHIVLCHPLLLPLLIFPSIRGFSSESAFHIRWKKYWSFSFSISPSNEYSGLISFRIDWLDLLTVQETVKSLLQHHSSKASVLWCSAFFIVQFSNPYMTTGKTIGWTRQFCWQSKVSAF